MTPRESEFHNMKNEWILKRRRQKSIARSLQAEKKRGRKFSQKIYRRNEEAEDGQGFQDAEPLMEDFEDPEPGWGPGESVGDKLLADLEAAAKSK